MKFIEWKTYRTRFLVQAKQLNSTLSFVDALGRQHCGRKGDYLVESSEGVLSIAPRRIFEDIYVPMLQAQSSETLTESQLNQLPIEALEVQEVRNQLLTPEVLRIVRPLPGDEPLLRSIPPRETVGGQSHCETPIRVRRKLPQPERNRRTPSSPSRLGLM